MVVVDAVGAQESAKMGLAQNEEMIEALAANGADDPLDKGVLPRRSGGRDHLPDPHGVNAPSEGLAVDRVAITKQVLRGGLFREGLDNLASCPGGRGVVGDVEVHEFATVVAEHHEDEQEA